MALFNFQLRFAPAIQQGIKTSTIRPIRKHPQKVGKPIHLYTGLRQTGAKRIIDPPICTAVKTIVMYENYDVELVDAVFTEKEAQLYKHASYDPRFWGYEIKKLEWPEIEKLAYHDGFFNEPTGKLDGCGDRMIEWFKKTYGLPFVGHINYWK